MLKISIVVGLFFLVNAVVAAPMEMTVCVTDQAMKENPQYYLLPNTKTRLLCERFDPKVRPRLVDMYKGGWRLLEVVKPDPRLVGMDKVASPMLYFEREIVQRKSKKKTR